MTNIAEIKEKIRLVDIISEKIKLAKKGVNFVGLCPFHNEKTPSFTISEKTDSYKCFGCGKSGDIFTFVMETENKSFIQAVEILAKKANVDFTFTNKKEYIKPLPRLEKLNKKMLSWFENDRKISNDTLLRMKITEGKEWMPKHEREVPVICFNYFKNEELTHIKFRAPKFINPDGKEEKSFKSSKDSELIFYNIDAIKDVDTAIICEGEIDCLTMVECGIYNSVSVPNGATTGANQRLEYLDNCFEYFTAKSKVILAVDNDFAGTKLKEELIRRLGKDKCYTIEYPDGCKDANDVLVKFGKDAVKELIANAKELPIDGIIETSNVLDTLVNWYENGYPKGIATHIAGFDHLLTFKTKELTIITGIPGHGKDEFLNLIMSRLVAHHNWKFAIASFEEETPVTMTKLMEKFNDKSFAFRKEKDSRITQSEFLNSLGLIDQNFFFINTSEVDISIDGILEKSKELVQKKGIKALVINPWNMLEHKIPAGYSETQYISEVLTKITNFLRIHDLHGFLIAHPFKTPKSKLTNKFEVPTLYSISGSANFFNKTHNGICVYRDYDDDTTEIYVQKCKQSWLGQIGSSKYKFNKELRTYEFLESSVNPKLEFYEMKPMEIDNHNAGIKSNYDIDLPF